MDVLSISSSLIHSEQKINSIDSPSYFSLPLHSAHPMDVASMIPAPIESIYGPSFSNKNIQDIGLQLISQDIQKNQYKGSALFLSNNQITDQGVLPLFKSLEQNKEVKHLILSKNQLSHFAIAGLSDLLKVNHFIGWLVLSKNPLKDAGILNLLPGLKKNKGL